MDAKQLKGRLRRKIIMHMLFQIGGAVVIVGALFKILHLEIGPITGGVVLGLGLGTRCFRHNTTPRSIGWFCVLSWKHQPASV